MFQPTLSFMIKSPWHIIAFGFGSGLAKKAPGTMGSLAALPFAIAISQLPMWLAGLAIVATLVIGTQACAVTSRAMGEHDHGSIVIDEFAGMFIAFTVLPFEPLWWIAGFATFRLLDIAKPWPINSLDKKVKGGWGIMLDDVVAGFMSACALVFAQSLL